MTSHLPSPKTEVNWSYDEIKRRTDESIRQFEAKQRAAKKRKAERDRIRKSGGGKEIARKILAPSTVSAIGSSGSSGRSDTDFDFGHNTGISQPENQTDESERYNCMGPVKCTRCGKHHGYCIELDNDKEKLKMLPSGDGTTNNSGKRKGGLNWIRNDMLSTTPKEAKILMVRLSENGQWGARVNIKLAFNGETCFLGLSPSKKDPRYKVLIENFGPDENNWVDQRIHLFLDQDDFTDAYLMKIAVPSTPKKGAK